MPTSSWRRGRGATASSAAACCGVAVGRTVSGCDTFAPGWCCPSLTVRLPRGCVIGSPSSALSRYPVKMASCSKGRRRARGGPRTRARARRARALRLRSVVGIGRHRRAAWPQSVRDAAPNHRQSPSACPIGVRMGTIHEVAIAARGGFRQAQPPGVAIAARGGFDRLNHRLVSDPGTPGGASR